MNNKLHRLHQDMKAVCLVICLVLFSHPSLAQSKTTATVDQYLNGFLSMSKNKCSSGESPAKRFEQEGRMAEAHSIRAAEKSLCSCMPERVRSLQSRLSTQETSEKLSEADFLRRFLPEIAHKCAADQLRSTYAEGCADRFSKRKSNSASYCSCMSAGLTELSDDVLAQAGSESADYTPRAAKASKRGTSPPEFPPALKRIASVDSMCSKQK